MSTVTIYTTPTCGYCKMAKAFFKDHSVTFQEVDVSTNKTAQDDMIKKSGQYGVPVIQIDNNIVVGFDQDKLSELLGVGEKKAA